MAQSVSAPAVVRPRLDAKGVFAAVLGNGFEFFDFTVYATFLGLIGQAFFPSDNVFVSDLAAAATFGVGFIARPLGGAMIGAYGDRAGRKPAMTLSIGLMAIGSALIAVTPGYAAIGAWAPLLLILARLVQGFAVGGEVGPATMFMLEAAPPNRRMFFASWQLASQNLGSSRQRPHRRDPGAAFDQVELQRLGLARAFRSRRPRRAGRRLHPQPARRDARQPGASPACGNGSDHSEGPAGELDGSPGWSRLVSGGTITQYFLITMTPYAIRTLHLPNSTAMLGSVTLGISGGLGALGGGVLADRFGIRMVTIVPRLLLMLLLFPVMKLLVANPSGATLIVVITVLSLLHAASAAVGIMLIPLIFPPAIRSTGMAICYSLGVAIFGGSATYVVTWLVGTTGNPLASTYYVMAASFVMLLAVLAVGNVDYDAKAWPPPVDSEV